MFFEVIKKWFCKYILKKEDLSTQLPLLETEDSSKSKDDQWQIEHSSKNNAIWEKICKIKINIKSFENILSDDYINYMDKLMQFENKYINQKQEYEETKNYEVLSVVIDPEEDLELAYEISQFDYEVDNFLINVVKPYIINLRLDKYITAIKKLYLAIRKDINSKHIQARIDEATSKFEEITSDTLDNDEKVAIIRNNKNLQDKFFHAKYLIAKLCTLTSEVSNLEIIFNLNEYTFYLVQLHKDLDELKSKLDKFSDSKYDKLKYDFERISNLNYLMPSEKVFSNRKFWLDFFDIEKTIYEEEKKMERKSKKSKVNTIDSSNMMNALNKVKLVTESEVKLNNCQKFIKWSKMFNIQSKYFKLVVDILSYIDSDISWEDIYNILTLFEVRHLIKDSILSSSDVLIQDLKDIYLRKFIDSYEKLRENKENIYNSYVADDNDILILNVKDASWVSKILYELKICSSFKTTTDSVNVYISAIYFSASKSFINTLKMKEEKND